MHIQFEKYPTSPRWVSAADRDDRPSYPFPPHSLPRRAPLKLAKVKQGLFNILFLIGAVLFAFSGTVAFTIALYIAFFVKT